MQYWAHRGAAVVWGGAPAGSRSRCWALPGSPDSGQGTLEQLQERGSPPGVPPCVTPAPAGGPVGGACASGKITLPGRRGARIDEGLSFV